MCERSRPDLPVAGIIKFKPARLDETTLPLRSSVSQLTKSFETEQVELGVSGLRDRTCVLVLGMHRSGTSALTRLLSLAGARLPLRLMGGEIGNQTGHWEPEALVAYHDQLLSQIGSAWHDWRGPDFSRLLPGRSETIKREITAIVEADYPTARLFVIKDPRVCRFAHLIIDALTEAGIATVPVLMFRNPLDVILSLNSRDGMSPADFSKADAALLWLRHALDADADTRNRPRAIISYDALLRDWSAVLAAIVEQTGVVFPHSADEIAPQVDAFISPGQRHYQHRDRQVHLDPVLRGWVADVYGALRIWSTLPVQIPHCLTSTRFAPNWPMHYL